MCEKKGIRSVIFASVCLVILILDTKTALSGAREGIDLCLKSIFPSLLPFCILSKLICSSVLGKNIPVLAPIGRLTGMPRGSESILLLSFISGYPVGAQCIDDACRQGAITKTDGARLLAFCNNAGPAFLFGILSCLFSTTTPLWSLYIIHILSAVIVGCLIPGKSCDVCILPKRSRITLTQAVEESIKTMVLVCGWVIVFRIILEFIECWAFWILNPTGQAIIAGILELSNGCIALQNIDCMGLRYILCSFILAYGGCCVGLQTIAVTRNTHWKWYFPGKILHAAISAILASLTQHFMFSGNNIYPIAGVTATSTIIVFCSTIFMRRKKKVVAITG